MSDDDDGRPNGGTGTAGPKKHDKDDKGKDKKKGSENNETETPEVGNGYGDTEYGDGDDLVVPNE